MLARWALALVALVAVGAGAHAQDAAEFYRGKTIQLVVGYGPGGGYDVYARVVARHLGKHIPGTPTVVVQNMPGAGSLVAVNYLYNTAPKDGTLIAAFAREMPMMGVLGYNPNARFDPKKLTWLGTPTSALDDAYIMFARKDAITSIKQVMGPGARQLVIGGTARGLGR